MENNPTLATEQKIISEADVDYSLWKILLISFFGFIASTTAGYFIGQGDFLTGLLSVIGFFAFLSLQVFLVKGFGKIALAILAESIGLVAASGLVKFGQIPFWILLAAGAIFFFFTLAAARTGRKYAENSLKLNFFRTTYSLLPRAIIAMIVFVSVIYGASFNPVKFLSPASFSAVLRPFQPLLSRYLPGVTFDSTMRAFLAKSAELTLQQQMISGQFELPAGQTSNQIIAGTAANFSTQLERYLGPIDPSKTISETIYSAVDQKLSNLIASWPAFLVSIVIGVLVFLLLKSVAFLVFWPTAFLGLIFYEVLLMIGFVRVSLETRSREIVLLN
jgi:hypothetical protein